MLNVARTVVDCGKAYSSGSKVAGWKGLKDKATIPDMECGISLATTFKSALWLTEAHVRWVKGKEGKAVPVTGRVVS
jgi:hypothetical protein